MRVSGARCDYKFGAGLCKYKWLDDRIDAINDRGTVQHTRSNKPGAEELEKTSDTGFPRDNTWYYSTVTS